MSTSQPFQQLFNSIIINISLFGKGIDEKDNNSVEMQAQNLNFGNTEKCSKSEGTQKGKI
jgi:hypothetical protein